MFRNDLEFINAVLPKVTNTLEMEWVEALEKVVAEIKQTTIQANLKENALIDCQADIQEMLTKVAEHQAKEERIKAELTDLRSKMDDSKLRLLEMSA